MPFSLDGVELSLLNCPALIETRLKLMRMPKVLPATSSGYRSYYIIINYDDIDVLLFAFCPLTYFLAKTVS